MWLSEPSEPTAARAEATDAITRLPGGTADLMSRAFRRYAGALVTLLRVHRVYLRMNRMDEQSSGR